ncbi:MAG: DUF2281 domain-containing protein [Acidobacteriota bacterium]
MSQEEFLREFNALPPEDKRLVADFIAFLQSRYKKPKPKKKSKRSDIKKEAFIGMWHDRDDMKDSSTWVRNLREREWKD